MILLDMEMPKNCKDCRINVYGRCGALRTSVLLEMANEERNVNCPIKAEIPKNATNGDVLMSVFKEVRYYSDGKICAEWWNAPWKGQKDAEQESE